MVLTDAERERYARQTRLPAWGHLAQEKLRAASVAVVGAGGLGSPALLYLAAAGVGRLGIVDDDVVAVSNLHRQVVHATSAVGRHKTDSAAERVRDLNPHVEVVEHRVRLTAANAVEVLDGYDVVVDGSDSFATRYLVNDTCLLLGVPLVWATVLGFDGQLSVFGGSGPCYRCLFPLPPDPGAVPSCAEAGVVGIVPGLLGVAQAAEAIRVVTGVGEPMSGRVSVYDGLSGRWSELPLRRNPACPACGEGGRPVPTDLDEECALPERALTPAVVARWLDERRQGRRAFEFVDLRDEDEGPALPGARRTPLAELRAGARPDAQLVVYCESGRRSARALAALLADGVDAYHLAGGAAAWRIDVRHA